MRSAGDSCLNGIRIEAEQMVSEGMYNYMHTYNANTSIHKKRYTYFHTSGNGGNYLPVVVEVLHNHYKIITDDLAQSHE